eukprot:scaffold148452_cov21-Tisochrysis_lutea.AAC.1
MSDPKLRDMYDRHGSEGLDDHANFMDSGEFFNMLFGSEKFEHLVGELAIACAVRTSRDLTPAQIKAIQAARVDKLAVYLKAMLQRHVVGDPDGFKAVAYMLALAFIAGDKGEVVCPEMWEIARDMRGTVMVQGVLGFLPMLRQAHVKGGLKLVHQLQAMQGTGCLELS